MAWWGALLALAVASACGRIDFRTIDGDARGDGIGDGDGAPGVLHASYLKASNTDTFDQFGFAVAMSADGTTLAVGAINESSDGTSEANNATTHSGAVYVFVHAGSTWQQQAYLKATLPATSDNFGAALALSADGNTLAIGAVNASAAYVFQRTGTTWLQQTKLAGSMTAATDQFGTSVALSADGNTLAVGSPFEDTVATDSGAAYVFVRAGTTWSEQVHLKAANADAMDEYGTSVALAEDGATVVVGAPTEDGGVGGINGNAADNSQLQAGAAYIYTRAGTTWSAQAYAKASTPITGDFFGEAVAASGDTVAIGAPGQDTLSNAGAVYVFVRAGTTWSQQAFVTAPNRDVDDQLGTGLALVGDTLVVGASLEDGGAGGINADQTDNSAADAGAAYLVTRTGTTWTPRRYLKATDPGAGDNFGLSVGLAADGSCVIGAFREDSSSRGIDSTADDADMDAGAAYVYSY